MFEQLVSYIFIIISMNESNPSIKKLGIDTFNPKEERKSQASSTSIAAEKIVTKQSIKYLPLQRSAQINMQDVFGNLGPNNFENEQIFKKSETDLINKNKASNEIVGAVNYQPTGGQFMLVNSGNNNVQEKMLNTITIDNKNVMLQQSQRRSSKSNRGSKSSKSKGKKQKSGESFVEENMNVRLNTPDRSTEQLLEPPRKVTKQRSNSKTQAPLEELPTIENPNKSTILVNIEKQPSSPVQESQLKPASQKRGASMKFKRALNKIRQKGDNNSPSNNARIGSGQNNELALIDKRIKGSKTIAEISFNMLRGERVRKSWLKDAEKNRFLRLDKVDDAERDQEQQVNSRQKRKKFSKPSASLAGIKQFEMDQCDTTAQIFQQQKDQFTNMTKKQSVETQYDIVTVLLNITSEHLVVLSEASESHFCVAIFDIQNHHVLFQFDIHGKFIKAKDFIQNREGNLFCIPYLDAGIFKFIVFDLNSIKHEVSVNELLDIDQSSQGIGGFYYPLINACFLRDDQMFVNVFHRSKVINFHFQYCCKTGRVSRQPVALRTNFSELNFPLNCFYEEESQLVYCLFRQSQCLTMSVKDPKESEKDQQDIFLKIRKINTSVQTRLQCTLWDKPKIQKFSDKAMGQFVLYKNQVLIAKSSKSLYFFRLKDDPQSEIKNDKNWEHYFKLKIIGDIFYSQGSQWLTVTSDVYIYFYKIEQDDLKPTLENCIYNFMNCSQLIYGQGDQNYCMTYKVGQQDFNIFERKFNHGFNVILDEQSKSNCLGVDCKSMECFLVSNGHTINVIEYETFREINKIELVLTSFQKGCIILNMKLCESERYLAILLGSVTTKQTYSINSLLIYEINMNEQTYDLKYTRAFPQSINGVSLQFEFFIKNVNEILFTDYKEIIRFDYVNYTINTYFQFKLQLNCTPEYVLFNSDQKIVMIASFYDVLWINLETDKELDIDNDFCIGNIRQIINYEKSFYILANKSNKKIGYYLIQIDEDNPVLTDSSYVVNSNSKYDIGDANLFILDNEYGEKHLMVSQKTIGVNTYNINVIDLKTRHIVFRYEMHQLWESTVRGLMLSTNEFIKLARDGMSMIKIFSSGQQKRVLKNMQGKRWMQHSLEHCNYLKITEENHILIEEKGSGKKKRRIISIQEQYTDPNGDTHFDIIYKIKVQNMSLMELLLFQSLFACKQQADIVSLIEAQPLPSVFYKSYDEIGFSNMVTVLSFDSRPIQKLLSPENNHLFSTKYPLIYKCMSSSNKNNCRKSQVDKSAIDISLESNQIRATTLIIEYVINHQNSYVFSFLFKNNLIKIVNRGVKVAKLLQSDIFCHKFDYEYWPSTHADSRTALRVYNGSIFQLRSMYKKVLPDFSQGDDQEIHNHDIKLYKIKYTLNLLPDMDYVEDGSLMNAFGDVEELEIFDNKVVKDLIEFKWNQYAGKFHYIGATIHVIYVLIFNYYVSSFLQEVDNNSESQQFVLYVLNFSMMFCLVYPLIYDMTQLRNQGFKEYFSDKWNHCDQLHIWCGFINCLIQLITRGGDVDNILVDRLQKSLMILVTFLMLIKTFFFLRIFHQLSYIVTMMKVVFYDLRVFMYFYLILLFMFSIILSILKVGNFEASHDPLVKNLREKSSYPNMEYKHLSYSLQNFMTVLRISLGDFNFEATTLLDSFDNIVFWIIWVIIVIMTCIIFLNFIIAEVSSSYESVKHDVTGLILKERASLIKESEDMMLESSKGNSKKFPKYIIMRECED